MQKCIGCRQALTDGKSAAAPIKALPTLWASNGDAISYRQRMSSYV